MTTYVLFDYLSASGGTYFDDLNAAPTSGSYIAVTPATVYAAGQSIDSTQTGPWLEANVYVTGQNLTFTNPLNLSVDPATVYATGQNIQLAYGTFFLNFNPASISVTGQSIALATIFQTNPTHIDWNSPAGIPLADIAGFQVGIRPTTSTTYTILPPMAFPTDRAQLIPPLPPGSYATAVMTFTYSVGPLGWSTPETFFTLIGIASPQALSVDSTGLISWLAVSGATTYTIGIRATAGAGLAGIAYPVILSGITGQTAQFPTYLPPGLYALAAKALMETEESLWSGETLFAVSAQPAPTTVYVS